VTAAPETAIDPNALAVLAAAGVATVYEASGRRGLIDIELAQIVPGSRVAGPARTVRYGQDDNRAVHEAMTMLRPGEVLVLTMPQPAPVALVGELLATQAKAAGSAGDRRIELRPARDAGGGLVCPRQ
jgi:4-hydroxy-4-methyl-2-oxoglutarate aldolase